MNIDRIPLLGKASKAIKNRRAKKKTNAGMVIPHPMGRPWKGVELSPNVTEGHIHITVNKGTDGAPTLESMLSDGQQIMLVNDAVKDGLELKGQQRYGQDLTADAEGIYLNSAEYNKYKDGNNIVVRQFTRDDILKKLLKPKGLVLAGTAVMTLLTGATAIGSSYEATPSGIASTQTPQSIVNTWTEEPKILLQAPNLTTDQVTQVRQLVQAREAVGKQCLQAREGHAPAPQESVPGVDCVKPEPYKTTHFWAWITAVCALITGVLGVIALLQKFGFQQKP